MIDAKDMRLKLNAITSKDVHLVGQVASKDESGKIIYQNTNITISIEDVKRIVNDCIK
jgi:hypothetical protein